MTKIERGRTLTTVNPIAISAVPVRGRRAVNTAVSGCAVIAVIYVSDRAVITVMIACIVVDQITCPKPTITTLMAPLIVPYRRICTAIAMYSVTSWLWGIDTHHPSVISVIVTTEMSH